MRIKIKPLADRFWEKVNKTDSCWLWTAGVGSKGYGKFCISLGNTGASAHRVSYELIKGKIPPGMTLHHTCENKLCVNPDHLQLLTNSEHTKLQHSQGKAFVSDSYRIKQEIRRKWEAEHVNGI